ncbi:BRO family protein [Homoserinimonas aerilata]|nr:BRO family protein [Homoserinimonas aerilata]
MPTTENSVAIFSYIGQDVRTLRGLDEIWFVAADVARILGYSEPAAMTRTLDEDEKGLRIVQTPGGDQSVLAINEPGLYSAILRSRRPEAKEFKRWVTHVVLPEIRQKGSYLAPVALDMGAIRQLNQAVATLLEHNEQVTAELAEATPRAEAWDAIASAEGDYSVGDAAKILARAGIPTGPQRLFAQLQQIGWTFRGGDMAWRARADRVDRGYLAEKPTFHYHPGTGARVVDPPQLRVTVKGIEQLRKRLHIGALKAVSA